jgi:hypothetical protein
MSARVTLARVSETAAVVLRIEDGRFTEIWSHHTHQEEMDQLWT